jgi:hypothetical protein
MCEALGSIPSTEKKKEKKKGKAHSKQSFTFGNIKETESHLCSFAPSAGVEPGPCTWQLLTPSSLLWAFSAPILIKF